ncbi:hypothetical protein LEMLEM_LOCUS18764 [Lemmus lemmus]
MLTAKSNELFWPSKTNHSLRTFFPDLNVFLNLTLTSVCRHHGLMHLQGVPRLLSALSLREPLVLILPCSYPGWCLPPQWETLLPKCKGNCTALPAEPRGGTAVHEPQISTS